MSSANETLRVVRLAVVSPGDVQQERDVVAAVVEELNRRLAPSRGLVLQVWRWETDARPGLHREGPQGLIDELMRIEDADVVVGIFWKRFGTPTGTASSGTEHELRKAWASWKDRGRPDVMLYFCTREATPQTQAEAQQWGQVLAFREDTPREQLWWAYDEVAVFERLVREHLMAILLRQDGEPAGAGTDGADPRPAGWPIRYNIPRVATAFTGRHEELQALEDALSTSGTAVITQAITGLGGIGKSQLAAAYVHRHLDAYDVIAWIRAEDGGAADLAELASRLDLAVDGLTLEDQARKAVDWLGSTDRRWLLALDNAPSPERLADLAPTVGSGHVLVTSRHRGMGEFGDILELDVFDEATAASYLMQRAGRPHDKAGAAELARALGGLPLALSHAGAYCASGTSFGDYLNLLEHLPARELFETSPERSHTQTVASTWRVSIAAAAEEAPLAKGLLDTAAFLGPEALPKSLFTALLVDPGDARHLKALHDALNALARYSLVSMTDSVVNVHRLLQKVVRDDCVEHGDRNAWHGAFAALLSTFPRHIDLPEEWSTCEQLLPHVLALWLHKDLLVDKAEPFVALINRVTHYLMWADRLALAPSLADASAQWAEDVLGDEPEGTRAARHRVAYLRRQSGAIDEACALYEQHAAETECILGPEHVVSLRSRLDLATTYRMARRPEDAVKILEPLVADHQRLFGDKDPKTLHTLQELATVYLEVRRLDDAIARLEVLAADRIEVVGPDHPSTLVTRSTLAAAYRTVGRVDEAMTLQSELLEACSRTLGPNHRTTLGTQSDLAGCQLESGNAEAAVDLNEDLVTRLRATVGDEHRDVLVSSFNLAVSYRQVGRHADALELMSQLMPKAQSIFGPEHQYVELMTLFYDQLRLAHEPGSRTS